MKILCIGPIWQGSNAGGLFNALKRQDVLTAIVDEFYHIPLHANSLTSKIVGKTFRKLFIADFNKEILKVADNFEPDIVLSYKGAFILPETLTYLKKQNYFLINFYPDVSFHTHGCLLQKTLGMYHKIFTTKTFGIHDLKEQLGVTNAHFIPHGFDPQVHRPIDKKAIPNEYFCDLSFIGTYSPKKEKILSHIKETIPSLKVLIWGDQWGKAKNPVLKDSIKLKSILGDLYAAGISASKINLAILSEKVKGSSSGDLITSRTFHIPAAGGFMLHEKNIESTKYFIEGKEAEFYADDEDLISKIKYYLEHEGERMNIASEGRQRALKDYSLDKRAQTLLSYLDS